VNRRQFLGGAAAAAASLLALRRARALGPGSQLRFGELGIAGAGKDAGRSRSGLERLGWELAFRTSIDVARDNPVPVSLGEKLFELPFLYLSGSRRFPLPQARELEVLRRHLTFGGMLLIDSSEGRAGGEFDASVRQLVLALFPPSSSPSGPGAAPGSGLVPVPADHVIHKSFYLTSSVAGRVAAAPALEALFLGGGLGGAPASASASFGGRAAIVYSQNDLGGAWAKDHLGNWAYQCVPGGELQREYAFRLGINLVMYAMCLDYKTDQVHVPFILKRRRWRVPGDEE
jgi:hypothetical protein